MKSITYRRRFCAHTFGRRSQRISRLTVLLLSSVMTQGWIQPAFASLYVVSAGVITNTPSVLGLPPLPYTSENVLGTAYDTTVALGGTQVVSSGGVTSGTVVSSGGTQQIVGGTDAGATVYGGGVQQILSGTASATSISGGTQQVAGGTALGATVFSGGIQQVSSGAAIATVVNSGGTEDVSGGLASGTVVNSAGTQIVSGSGTANGTTVNTGFQYVADGGTATGTMVNGLSAGPVVAQVISMTVGAALSGGPFSISAVPSAPNGITIVVSSGGSTQSVTIDTALQTVDSGGTATSNTIVAGIQLVNSGGATSNNTLFGGIQIANGSGSTATGNTLAGSVQIVDNGGAVTSNTLTGSMQVLEIGGTATSNTLNASYQFIGFESTATSNTLDLSVQDVGIGGTANDTVLNQSVQSIEYGGTANSNTVNSGSTQYVYSGGAANVTAVNAGGNQDVYGGSALSNTINNAGTQTVASGGVASSNLIESGGTQFIVSAGVASATAVNSGGVQSVDSGGTAITTTVNTGGAQNLSGGSFVSNTTLNGGSQNVNNGAVANLTTVNAAGLQTVNSGAMTSGTVINNGGTQVVMEGGMTSGSVVNSGGSQNVLGMVASATVNGGGTLTVGNGASDGNLVGNAHNNGTLIFDLAGTYTYNSAFSGSGTIVQAHSGTLVFNGTSPTYSGTTQVLAGTLAVGDSNHSSATLGGDVTVGSGGTLRGHGTIGGDVVNDGIVNPGGSIGTTTIAGNYAQASSAALEVEISPSAASQLNVLGNATLAGTLAVVYDAGSNGGTSTYGPGTVHLLKASSVSGTFSGQPDNIVESGANLSYVTPSVSYKATSVDLVLTPIDTSIFTAMGSAASQAAQATNATILDRLSHICRTNNTRDCFTGADQVWIKATGEYERVDDDGSISGYSAHQYGFVAGYDHRIDRYTVGGTLGYSHVDVGEAQTPDTGTIDSVRWSAYGATWTGPVNLAATIGMGYDFIDQKRPFDTATGTATSSHDGLEFTAAAQASMPLPSLGGFVLVPRMGLRFAYFHRNAYAESGAGNQDLAVGTDNIQSVQPYVQLALRYAFDSASKPANLEAYVGYAREVGSTDRAVSVSAQDGTLFTASGAPLPQNLLTAGFSLNMRVMPSLWVSASFDTLVHTEHASVKAGSVKLDYRF